MILGEFTSEMTRRGCVSDGKNFCGTYQGYPFSVLFLNGTARGRTQFALRIQFAQKVPGAMYKQAKAAVKGLAKVQKAQSPATLYNALATVPKNDNFNQAFDNLMDASVNAARSLALAAPTTCPICKQPGCDAYAFHGASYQPVHQYCVQNQAADKNQKAQQNELNGSYGLGFVGAVLGGIVGAIPTILLAVFGNLISGWLCALIPLGAYYGYKLLRGRMNRMALVMSILVSVLLAPIVYYLMQDLSVYKELGQMVGPAFFLEYLKEYPEDIVPGLLQTLLFVGLGVLIVSGIISRTNTHVVGEANYSLATLRPMQGAAAPQPAPTPAQAPAQPNQPPQP